jgi:hypothetical protein
VRIFACPWRSIFMATPSLIIFIQPLRGGEGQAGVYLHKP